MKKSFTTKALILSFIMSLFLAGCGLFGQPPCVGCGDSPWGHRWGHKSFMGERCPFAGHCISASCCILKNKTKLSLTNDQEARIKTISARTKKNTIQLKADSEKISVDIKAKFAEEGFDAVGINALIDKKVELKKQLVKSFVNSHAEVLSILTPEQKTKLKEIKKDCKKSCCSSKGDCCD